MASDALLRTIEVIAGAVLTVIVLLDIFLTVLYARAGIALCSPLVSRTWCGVRRVVARPFGRQRGTARWLCGPLILVVLVLVWSAGLALGSALTMHPHLGGGVVASQGATPRDFMS